MRTFLKAVFICGVLLVAFAMFVEAHSDKSSGNSASNGSSEREGIASEDATEQAQRVSALKLFIDYQRNEVAADRLYKGHLLAVTGMVTSINKDLFGKIYIALATPNEFMNVQAHMERGSESQAAALERGQGVTVICTGGGMIIGSPMLQNCSFARLREETPASPASSETQPKQPTLQQSEVSTSSEQADITRTAPESDSPKTTAAKSAPVVVATAEPEFPSAAIQAGMGATVFVHLTVDRNGLPSDVQAVRAVYIDRAGHASGGANSAGSNLGFSESAVNAVKKYKFRPAMENGIPVPVELNVDVNFNTP